MQRDTGSVRSVTTILCGLLIIGLAICGMTVVDIVCDRIEEKKDLNRKDER